MNETPSSTDISTRLLGIANLSRKLEGAPLTTLAHHIDLDWMREAFRRTRKGGRRASTGRVLRTSRRTWTGTCWRC